jgi:hypothetical protein
VGHHLHRLRTRNPPPRGTSPPPVARKPGPAGGRGREGIAPIAAFGYEDRGWPGNVPALDISSDDGHCAALGFWTECSNTTDLSNRFQTLLTTHWAVNADERTASSIATTPSW